MEGEKRERERKKESKCDVEVRGSRGVIGVGGWRRWMGEVTKKKLGGWRERNEILMNMNTKFNC